MALIENRAAEEGSIILTGPVTKVFVRQPIAIRVLADAVITTITGTNVEGLGAFYDGATVTKTDPVILGNIVSIVLASGTVQAIY